MREVRPGPGALPDAFDGLAWSHLLLPERKCLSLLRLFAAPFLIPARHSRGPPVGRETSLSLVQPSMDTALGQSKMLYGQVGASEILTSAVKQQLGLRTGATTDAGTSITGVRDGSPAFQGGLQVGDYVTSVDRQGA